MKKFFLIVMIIFLSKNVNSLELLCYGEKPRLQTQKQIFVNCSNRKEVIDILGWGWQKLRQQGIAGVTEDMCYKPYIRAKELHPSISFDGVAQTFLMECNMGLQYLK